MDIEERMAKAETDIAVLKEAQRALLQGQADLRDEIGKLREVVERGFAEERAARERAFRWTFSAVIAILALVLGMVARMAGIL